MLPTWLPLAEVVLGSHQRSDGSTLGTSPFSEDMPVSLPEPLSSGVRWSKPWPCDGGNHVEAEATDGGQMRFQVSSKKNKMSHLAV